MTGIAIAAFRGQVPRTSKRLLQDNQAQQALNCKITSGRIDPFKGLTLSSATAIGSAIKSMYRYRYNDKYNWFVFSGTVDCARSPVAQDSLGRVYMTGDGEPRMSTYSDAIQGSVYPYLSYTLGVFVPTTAMAINVTGGTGVNEDRAYVYTFKTTYGEESGPSPATLKTGKTDGSWDITGMDSKPLNNGTVSTAVKDTPVAGQVTVTLNSVFGLSAYEKVTFSSVVGMTDLNASFIIQNVDKALNKVVVTLATAQTYTSGGAWVRANPHNTTGMTKAIYRTVGTGTDYKFVAEIDGALTSYSDTIPATAVSLNSGIATLSALPPIKNMHSIVLLSNGVMAGIANGQVCLSEQGKPYSWPLSNRYSFPGTGIALVATSNSALVLTDGFAYIVTASVPEAATVSKVSGDVLAPCVSKQGVVDIGSGALYPSNDGLYVVTASGVRNVTSELYTIDEWKVLQPATFKAGFQDNRYYALHDSTSASKIFMMHIKEADSVIEINETADALYSNQLDGRLYLAKGANIYLWDDDDSKRYAAFWQSKEYQLSKPVSLSFAQVQAKYEDIVPVDTTIQTANNALLSNISNIIGDFSSMELLTTELSGSNLQAVPVATGNTIDFSLVVDGTVTFTKALTSSKPFRLPAGKKSEIYSVQITSSVPVYSINAAQGVKELSGASL